MLSTGSRVAAAVVASVIAGAAIAAATAVVRRARRQRQQQQKVADGRACAQCFQCEAKENHENTDRAELSRCSACRRVAYCSRACQQAHWAAHKADCRRLAKAERMPFLWDEEAELMHQTKAASISVPLLPECWSKIFDFADLKTFSRMRRCCKEWHRIASLPTSSTALSQQPTVFVALLPDPTGARLTLERAQSSLLRQLKCYAWPVVNLHLCGLPKLYKQGAVHALDLSPAERRLRELTFEVINNIAAEILRLRALGTPEQRKLVLASDPAPLPSTLEQLAGRFLKLDSLGVHFTDVGDLSLIFKAFAPIVRKLEFIEVRAVHLDAIDAFTLERLRVARSAAKQHTPASALRSLVIQTVRGEQPLQPLSWLEHAVDLAVRYGASLPELNLSLPSPCHLESLEKINAIHLPRLDKLTLWIVRARPFPSRAFASLATLPLRDLSIGTSQPLSATQLRVLAGEVDSATEAEWQQKLRAAQDSGAAPHLDGVSAQSLLKRCVGSLRSAYIECAVEDDAVRALNNFSQLQSLRLGDLLFPFSLAKLRLLSPALPLASLTTSNIPLDERLRCRNYLATTFPAMLRAVDPAEAHCAALRAPGMESVALQWHQAERANGGAPMPPSSLWRERASGRLFREEHPQCAIPHDRVRCKARLVEIVSNRQLVDRLRARIAQCKSERKLAECSRYERELAVFLERGKPKGARIEVIQTDTETHDQV